MVATSVWHLNLSTTMIEIRKLLFGGVLLGSLVILFSPLDNHLVGARTILKRQTGDDDGIGFAANEENAGEAAAAALAAPRSDEDALSSNDDNNVARKPLQERAANHPTVKKDLKEVQIDESRSSIGGSDSMEGELRSASMEGEESGETRSSEVQQPPSSDETSSKGEINKVVTSATSPTPSKPANDDKSRDDAASDNSADDAAAAAAAAAASSSRSSSIESDPIESARAITGTLKPTTTNEEAGLSRSDVSGEDGGSSRSDGQDGGGDESSISDAASKGHSRSGKPELINDQTDSSKDEKANQQKSAQDQQNDGESRSDTLSDEANSSGENLILAPDTGFSSFATSSTTAKPKAAVKKAGSVIEMSGEDGDSRNDLPSMNDSEPRSELGGDSSEPRSGLDTSQNENNMTATTPATTTTAPIASQEEGNENPINEDAAAADGKRSGGLDDNVSDYIDGPKNEPAPAASGSRASLDKGKSKPSGRPNKTTKKEAGDDSQELNNEKDLDSSKDGDQDKSASSKPVDWSNEPNKTTKPPKKPSKKKKLAAKDRATTKAPNANNATTTTMLPASIEGTTSKKLSPALTGPPKKLYDNAGAGNQTTSRKPRRKPKSKPRPYWEKRVTTLPPTLNATSTTHSPESSDVSTTEKPKKKPKSTTAPQIVTIFSTTTSKPARTSLRPTITSSRPTKPPKPTSRHTTKPASTSSRPKTRTTPKPMRTSTLRPTSTSSKPASTSSKPKTSTTSKPTSTTSSKPFSISIRPPTTSPKPTLKPQTFILPTIAALSSPAPTTTTTKPCDKNTLVDVRPIKLGKLQDECNCDIPNDEQVVALVMTKRGGFKGRKLNAKAIEKIMLNKVNGQQMDDIKAGKAIEVSTNNTYVFPAGHYYFPNPMRFAGFVSP